MKEGQRNKPPQKQNSSKKELNPNLLRFIGLGSSLLFLTGCNAPKFSEVIDGFFKSAYTEPLRQGLIGLARLSQPIVDFINQFGQHLIK